MRKSRRKSRVARGRKRNAKGHFVKAKSAPARRRRRRSAAKAPASTPRRRRRRRAAAKAPVAPRRRRRRARAAAPASTPPRRRRRRRAAAKAPVAPRRRRRRARAKARDWRGQPRRHRRAAKKGWGRRRRHVRGYAAPRRRRGRKRYTRASDWRGQPRRHRRAAKKGWSRRRRHVKGYAAPRRRRRKSTARRRGYTYGGKRYSRRTPRHHRLPKGEYPEATPSEGYALSNPLSGGELVLVGITGIIGYGLADFVGRYMQTTPVASGAANSIPTGQTVGNDVATTAFPSWQAMAAQFGVAAVPGIAAAFVDSPWGRAALQGMMLGAGFALFGGLFKSLMASTIGSTALGQQLYLAEIEAQAAVTAAGGSVSAASATPATTAAPATTTMPAATTTAPAMAGLPRGVGARPMLRDPGPTARGMGQAQPPMTFAPPLTQAGMPPYSPGGPGNAPPPLPGGSVPPAIHQPGLPTQPRLGDPGAGILTNTGDVVPTSPPGTPTVGGPSTGPMCTPCSPSSGGIAATHQSAMDAIRDESCLGALPRGFGMYHSFPSEEAA